MTRAARQLVPAVLLITALAGCSYGFTNPAEDLRAGEVQGLLVVARPGAPGTFDPAANVVVGLRNSGLVELSRPTGYFTFLDLPAGRHTLLFRKGVSQGLAVQVDMEPGSDGQPQGIMLGDLQLRDMAVVKGSLTGSGPDQSGSDCAVVDAITGLATHCLYGDGSFEFSAMPVGEHRLRFAANLQVSPPSTTTPVMVGELPAFTLSDTAAGTIKDLGLITLHAPAAGATGTLRFRIRVLGADLAATLAGLTVSLDATSLPVEPDGTVTVAAAAEGYHQITFTASSGAGDLVLPGTLPAVVLATEETDLGDVYVFSGTRAAEVQADCRSDADCAPGTCQSNLCPALTTPAGLPPSFEVCNTGLPCSGFGGSCSGTGWDCGLSAPPVPAGGFCMQCGTTCTSDGATVFGPPSSSGGTCP